MNTTFNELGKKFGIAGTVCSYEALNGGLINYTWKVTFAQDDLREKDYIFQGVNTFVFKHPKEMMSNIGRVTEYLCETYPDQASLRFYKTEDGVNYWVGEDDMFWRVADYVDSVTFDVADDLAVVEAAGKAFGQFQARLADFDGASLYETIPDFHNTKKRIDTLFAHVQEDPCGMAGEAGTELEYIASVREKASELSVRLEAGDFPKRVTHNDTKCSNVLFHKETREPIMVIDLDTIMPGMSVYDFGDAVRSLANTAAEDEYDLGKVTFDVEKFRAFTRGFLGAAGGILEPVEIESLVLAAFSVTVELAARFLDDFITGDHYFHISYKGQNFLRARCQLQLAKDIEAKWDLLTEIVREAAAGAVE